MFNIIKGYLLPLNTAEHILDNYIFDTVQPIIGSVVYCDFIIAASAIQHSGIYVGNGNIVHLNGDGVVEKVSATEFVSGLMGFKCGSSIYVSCEGTTPVGDSFAADLALSKVGNKYDYRIYKDNCHRFVAECIGFDASSDNLKGEDFSVKTAAKLLSTLTGVKVACRYLIDSDNWRVWDR